MEPNNTLSKIIEAVANLSVEEQNQLAASLTDLYVSKGKKPEEKNDIPASGPSL
jgi:hypothetical protein